ncbi:FUSC family protein [Brenneria uluponensis]|uniref:FUSC family protein n=1 Tax=Brenneria uluponensis TaxID=3057057 RepID=UPI0028E6C9CC|nr:FUSC family protein [Brenneria ulupoensis]
MMKRARWLEGMLDEIAWRPLMWALLVVSPSVILFFIFGNTHWLATTALVSMCTMIVEERLVLTPFGVLLHGVAITAGFVILVTASSSSTFFVALCAVMTVASIWLTIKGHALRSLGNFTFIPTLYLASESLEASTAQQLIVHAAHELPYILIGLVPVIILAVLRHSAQERSSSFVIYGQRTFFLLSHRTDFGERRQVVEACLTIACAVGLAATLVEWQSLNHGQWVIWSAASVVTGESGTEHRKLFDRAFGALIGVPVGIVAGWELPHTASAYGMSVIAALLTLIAFRRYILGFGSRCAFIALALTVGGQAVSVAGERIINVILGGLIGITCVLVVRWLSSAFGNRPHSQSH